MLRVFVFCCTLFSAIAAWSEANTFIANTLLDKGCAETGNGSCIDETIQMNQDAFLKEFQNYLPGSRTWSVASTDMVRVVKEAKEFVGEDSEFSQTLNNNAGQVIGAVSFKNKDRDEGDASWYYTVALFFASGEMIWLDFDWGD